MNSSTVITEMTIADYDSVRQLLGRMPGVVVRSTDSREATERYLARNPGLSFIARVGDRMVGCVMCGNDGRRGHLRHLAVEPAMRRQGIGTALVGRCLEALKRDGIEKTHIDVLVENQLGHEYWTKSRWQRRSDIVRYSFTNAPDPNA